MSSSAKSANGLPASRYPSYSRAMWCLFLVLTTLLLLAFCPVAVSRAVRHGGGTDFPEFYEAGAYLVQHGVTQPMSKAAYYLPSIDGMFALVSRMPLPVASAVWYLIGAVGWIGALLATYRYILVDMDESLRRESLALAALVTVPLALDGLCIGAFHTLMLWWWLAGLGRVSQGRDVSGGILLGMAVWIKLLPALGVAYLMLKGRWKAIVTAGVAAVVMNVLLSLAAFGPVGAYKAHVAWMNRDAAGTVGMLLNQPTHAAEERITNQSLLSVLRRVTTQFGVSQGQFDVSPEGLDRAERTANHYMVVRDKVALGNLTSTQLKLLYVTISGALLLFFAWLLRRPGDRLSAEDWSAEIALVVASSLWFSPIAPSYHPMVMMPLLALLFARRSFQPLGVAALAIWLLALAGHGWSLARGFGHMLWLTMVLGGMLIFLMRKSGVDREAEPTSAECEPT